MKAGSKRKPVVAAYPGHYLTVSMTFVYRQILGVADKFTPVVLATTTDNLELFPCDNLHVCEKGFLWKTRQKIANTLTGKGQYSLSPAQERFFTQTLQNQDAALIHAHFGPRGIELLPVAKRLQIPLVVTFHGYDASTLLNDKAYRSRLKCLLAYAHVIVVSEHMAETLFSLGARPERTSVLYCGIPTDKFSYLDRPDLSAITQRRDTVQFLQVSNFVEKKGHEYTVRAFAAVSEHYPNCHLVLAGSGPLLHEVKALCENLGIDGKVSFPGVVREDEVVLLMKAANVFLHHSVTAPNGDKEGIPTVIMEAMSTGLPPISTYHSGIPELIDDGVNGYLVEEMDIKAYTGKMLSILESDNRLSKHAAQTVQTDFNSAVQDVKLGEIYDEVLHA